MALFEADRHEELTQAAWHETRVRAAIADIVADTAAAYRGPAGLWPLHPLDVSPERPAALKPLYYGAGGVVWALHRLADDGFAGPDQEYRAMVATLAVRHGEDARYLRGEASISYPLGTTGLAILDWALSSSDAAADTIAASIAANLDGPTVGFAWGTAGSMLAALFLWRRTGEARWHDLFLRGADRLWEAWTFDPAIGCHLWTQTLYGEVDCFLGALHGDAGMLHVLLAGRDLLPEDRRSELERRAAEMLAATAICEDGQANWRLCAEGSRHPGQPDLRVQHCTGAPGIVNALSGLPREARTDALLLAAGELAWAAGPLAKLPSLCHGAPGTGYAFLKLHARTGDAVWLARARHFAMHAIEQAERGKARFGQRKFSLWTGDLGLACYLADCIAVRDRVPLLDVFV